jgi:hypothetical protein
VADSNIDPDDPVVTVAGGHGPLDLDGEGDVPAVGSAGDGGGQNAGGALLEASGELPGGFMGLEDADAGELDVLAVGKQLDGAGGEPAGVPTAPLPLESWEGDRAALTTAAPRVAPVLQRPGQPIKAGGVGLLAVLGPPGSDLLFGAIPLPPQLGQGPWHLDVLTSVTLVESGFHQLQAPVVGDPGGTAVGRQSTALGWGRVQREPVGLHDPGHRDGSRARDCRPR